MKLGEVTIDAFVTEAKLRGAQGAVLNGFTTPERMPFVLVLGIGANVPEVRELFSELLVRLQEAGKTRYTERFEDPNVCQHCGSKVGA